MVEYSTGQVAEILGVSVDTVRRLCDDGRLVFSDNGRRRSINGEDLAEYVSNRQAAYEADSSVARSARNRFSGIVTRIDRDKLVAVVEIYAQSNRLVSIVTREAVDDLELTVGDLATAVVKATNVIVEKNVDD